MPGFGTVILSSTLEDQAMTQLLDHPLTGPCVWRGAELQADDSWIHTLQAPEIAEIDSALSTSRSIRCDFSILKPQDFALPVFAQTLEGIADELENGRGFVLIRGLPVERYSEEDIEAACFGIGLNLGFPVRQNPRGDLLGKVMNVGDLSDPTTRVYETNAYLPYHTDPSDVFGLLCVQPAVSGGLSSIVSAGAVYNDILKQHRDLLGVYYRPFYYAHLGDELPGLSPVFSFNEGKLACRYLRQYIELGHSVMQVPLTALEVEALDVFDALTHTPGMRLDMMLEPGDFLIANNYAVLHSRTEFEDHENLARRRKLLRLWLKMRNARSLAPAFPGRNGFGALDFDNL